MRTIEQEKDLKDLLEDIKEMKSGSAEQLYLVTTYSLSNYIKSLIAFGSKSKITKDNLNIIKEMFNILKEERKLLNYILRNIYVIDPFSALLVIGLLDETNDKTVNYYYQVMGDIEEACEMKQEFRGIRRKQDFPTLIQDTSYAKEVIALCENEDSLKEFLGYEESFWKFISKRLKIVDTDINIARKTSYAIPIYDGDIVVDIDLLVPKVVDLQTALLALSIYVKAYKIYKSLGQEYQRISEEEIDAVTDKYLKLYLENKVKTVI